MKTLKLLALALPICILSACNSNNKTATDTPTSPEDQVVPGVGAAPDSSDRADTTQQKMDTTGMKKQ
jgi:hypothetical protein